MLYSYPKETLKNAEIPKEKFFYINKERISPRLENLFNEEISRIIWQNVLNRRTLNIPKTNKIPEIAVLRIEPQIKNVSSDILRLINKAVPLPIIFEIYFEGLVKTITRYKRPSKKDEFDVVTEGRYLYTHWKVASNERKTLPTANNLENLYNLICVDFWKQPQFKTQNLNDYEEIVETNSLFDLEQDYNDISDHIRSVTGGEVSYLHETTESQNHNLIVDEENRMKLKHLINERDALMDVLVNPMSPYARKGLEKKIENIKREIMMYT